MQAGRRNEAKSKPNCLIINPMAKPTSQLPMDLAPQREVYTVSRLNREARAILEGRFQLLWLEGEISNFARPASGHWYFSLKDAQAQVRCAMFRQNNMRLKFLPEDGMHLLVRARVSLYEGRGEFQLIVEHAEPAGEGLLRLQFEQLKLKLAAEGLFADSTKKALPQFPESVGVITSPTGAAIRDVLSVLRRRAPHIEVIIYPVPVQGSTAAPQIAAMIATADARAECDVLLLARGGGSLEDLWPFNEEVVARAIYACRIPIVSGVGHEIDFTIADFVADVRAPTPSAAAELISPDRRELLALLRTLGARMTRQLRDLLAQQRQRLTWLSRRMVHPGRRLQELSQRLDDVSARFASSLLGQLQGRAAKLAQIGARLNAQSPAQRLRLLREQLSTLRRRLVQSTSNGLKNYAARLSPLGRALHAVSPLATLDRGYAIVSTPDSKILRDVQQVQRGDKIIARLARGRLDCSVEGIDIDAEPSKQ
jgi:exodeoxyribonuclease VII large subunit